jgi:hypothetical protein
MRKLHDSLCANRGCKWLILLGRSCQVMRDPIFWWGGPFFVKLCANVGGNCQSMRKPHDSLCANRGCKRLILVAVATPYARPHRNFFILGFLSSYARISVEIVRVCANFMSLCANRGRNRLILVGATPYARPHRAAAELRKKNRTSFFKSMQNTCLFRLHGAGKTSPQSIARHDDCTSPWRSGRNGRKRHCRCHGPCRTQLRNCAESANGETASLPRFRSCLSISVRGGLLCRSAEIYRKPGTRERVTRYDAAD